MNTNDSPRALRPSVDDRLVRGIDGCVLANHAADVLEVMRAAGVSLMPVLGSWSDPRPCGVVRRADVEQALQASSAVRIGDLRLLDAPQVRSGTPLDEVLEAAHHSPVVLVVDSSGGCLGIVELGPSPGDGILKA